MTTINSLDVLAGRARGKCRHFDRIVEDGGPRNPWRGYTFCGDCGETIGLQWKRKIDDVCQRNWGFRPNKTKPLKASAQ